MGILSKLNASALLPVTPNELKTYLNHLVSKHIQISTMIWGAPGIGKSSIVAQIAQDCDLDFVDVRLSQLAPTDLRGLPVAKNGISKWYPPEFLPHNGKGILFLDELNMAPPSYARSRPTANFRSARWLLYRPGRQVCIGSRQS